MDRLDYFIDQLARRGIYANLNLHVGRAHSHYLDVPPLEHNYDKVYTLFAPALVKAQRDYARALLTHVNVYRRVRYADDPAVAFVEITNENSFFMWDGDQTLRSLRPYYAKMLQGRYNEWLARRYGQRQALAAAWSKGARALGDDLIRNGRVEAAAGAWPADWTLEQHGDCRATLSHTAKGARIEIRRHDQTAWHLQLNQRNLAVEGDTYYTAIFAARSDAPRSLTCEVGQAHDPWRNLGLSRAVELGPAWKIYRLGFVATAGDTNARLNFSFGGDATAFELTDLQLRPGGQAGLNSAESWNSGSIALFAENESEQRQQDRLVFLAQTEKAYFEGMRRFLRHELSCQALVTGTMVFGPLGLYAQSGMDYVDGHAYWQHPHFPGRSWDAGNWRVEQRPMVDVPQEATLFRLAAERLQGKPYTVS
ncbi:MAG: carbohydrate binding domain-containing protein, partial [Planctomycetes bacterium]|nr:carbohydrate binding domain-containing protein [Planctomycetota bacterium]